METIFALSGGALPAGVAVIRVSGKAVPALVQHFCGRLPAPRKMTYTNIIAANDEILDKGLVVYFPEPYSFTGEDCAEFHIHGSKALARRFLEELSLQKHCRPAEPGEFSRRAFANGKMDLTEAEGLADLLAAETESQRKLAMQGASGALKKMYHDWRKRLIKARAMIEAELDFAEEEDVAGAVSATVRQDLAALQTEILQHTRHAKTAEIMRDGLKIVLAGEPNSGKSSFVNRLIGRDAAIVTDEAGTTRDALEIRLIIEGMPVIVTDTAGLRQTSHKIEQIGIATATERIKEADLVLCLADMHAKSAESAENTLETALAETKAEIWRIGNKLDLGLGSEKIWPIQISVTTGLGWQQFLQKLHQFCREKQGSAGTLLPARERQLHLLQTAAEECAKALADEKAPLELQAEYLRYASNALGKITGDIDAEDLLDVIFSEFCIGK